MQKEIKIYVLLCPFTSKVKYIGRTGNNLDVRLRGHISKAKTGNTPKNQWILYLKTKGLKPTIKLFKTVNCNWSESHLIERNLINKCIKYSFDLKNLDDRGEGFQNRKLTEDQKLKISNSLKERYEKGLKIKENFRKVCIYDLNGVFVKEFESIKDCAKFLNTNVKAGVSGVEKCLYLPKINLSYKSYQIRYKEDTPPTIYKTTMHKFNLKKVIIKNIQTNEIQNFNSISELCKWFKTSDNNIRRYFNNNKLYKDIYYIQVPQLKKTLLNGETPII